MSPAQRMSEGHIRPDVPTLPRGRGDRLATHAAPGPHGEDDPAAQGSRLPHGSAPRSPRRAPLPNAPGGTSRRPQRHLAPKRGRRSPGLPRCPSPRTRPLRGPRCRRRRRSTSSSRLHISCPCVLVAMPVMPPSKNKAEALVRPRHIKPYRVLTSGSILTNRDWRSIGFVVWTSPC